MGALRGLPWLVLIALSLAVVALPVECTGQFSEGRVQPKPQQRLMLQDLARFSDSWAVDGGDDAPAQENDSDADDNSTSTSQVEQNNDSNSDSDNDNDTDDDNSTSTSQQQGNNSQSNVNSTTSSGAGATPNSSTSNNGATPVTGPNRTQTTNVTIIGAASNGTSSGGTDIAAPPKVVPSIPELVFNTTEDLTNATDDYDPLDRPKQVPLFNVSKGTKGTAVTSHKPIPPVIVRQHTEIVERPGVLSVARALQDISAEPFMGTVDKNRDYTNVVSQTDRLQVPPAYNVQNPHSWTSAMNASRSVGLPKQSDEAYHYDVTVATPEGLSVFASAQYQVEKLTARRNRLMDEVDSVARHRQDRQGRLQTAFDAVDRLYSQYFKMIKEESDETKDGYKPENLQYFAREIVAAQDREYDLASQWLARAPRVSDRRARLRINALRLEAAVAAVLSRTVDAVAPQSAPKPTQPTPKPIQKPSGQEVEADTQNQEILEQEPKTGQSQELPEEQDEIDTAAE